MADAAASGQGYQWSAFLFTSYTDGGLVDGRVPGEVGTT
jgi:hypothetical protein